MKILSLLIFSCLIGFISCKTSSHSKDAIESAMQHYDHLILQQNADSIAMIYTSDGDLGGIAKGRDSIRNFLSSFKNVAVISQASKTTQIDIKGDTAIQKGTYAQADVVNGKDTMRVKGEYTAKWEWDGNKWLVKSMATKPLQ